ILAMKTYFAGRNCTVLLLDDRTAEGNDLQLQSIAHGVILMQSLEREFGNKRRRIEIRKMRGMRFREGFHDYGIETGGVVVHPRLVASEHRQHSSREPLLSGIPELDDLFGGGIDRGTSTLMIGPAGSGKSTIAVRYAATAAERGELAVIFTFDETIATLLHRAAGLGIPLKAHIDSGKIVVRQIDPAELSPGEFISQVCRFVGDHQARVVVIDSLNGFLNAMPGESFLAVQMHELLAYLNQKGVASIMTLAQHGFVGTNMATPVDVSYLADSVLFFRFFEANGAVKQAISVLKKRSGGHERSIRELIFANGHIRVGASLADFRGVLTGVPTYVGGGEHLGGNAHGKLTRSDSE
ncbi:MAG: AAA family ATPase, partial [Acidobacteriaceae bacterium]|nr:AAA family ATPase [Acidobacteriaceae bacterium]